MKVGVVTSLFPSQPRPREGVFALRRWAGMAARGHRVHVIQPLPFAPPLLVRGERAELARMAAREVREGIPVLRPRYLHLPRSARGNARRFAARALAALAQGDVPDVVVCDYAWPASACAPALARRGLPCVVNGRGSDVLQVAGESDLGPLLALNLRAAGHWTAVSADLVRAMDRLAGLPGRGRLVPNGVDAERFRPGDRGEACARIGLAPGGPLVLVVGHLIPRKDPLLALEVFRRGAPEAARLVFVGRGPLEGELRAAIDRAGLSERVQLVGEAEPDTLADYYRAADVLLLTSHREGRPNVVLEALASGLPVVASAVGGTPELLANLPGSLAPDGDVEAFCERLTANLHRPPAAAECRAAVADLTWEASLEALERALAEAVEPCP
ncbi:glycosyltransferase [Engelhardtia mirabilis]|uniref:Teichuronic acid biosynthesis glycosyltransferase TuaC n=1 Tax=Engelhardtia mirabilis TaxID=2528011 RepID=A0A518BKC4_9BACT|nr:Putative teichuronic acid biosynthesis glycosyltransferase TuaC [Planctomycetes bacterium Pla133]QDV01756.1 Putative teichuronic acid biosynthesis glycosyltransferase TuaC [Planctomycetes bacterium Pla86]